MKAKIVSISLVFVIAAGSWAADGSDGKTWAGFRGDGTGVTTAKHLPTKWSPTENIGWKVELAGYGQSSPVVWGDKVFVTSVDGPNRETGYMLCHELKTGKELWRYKFEPSHKMKWSDLISRAAPTPVVDANGVYAFFEGGNLFGFDHNGKILWQRSLVKETGEFKNEFSLGSSLAQSENAIYVLIDDPGPSYLLAVNKKNGETNWKMNRTSRSSWTSPVIAMFGGNETVIVSSDGTVAAYTAKDGKLLWEKGDFAGNTVASATVSGDLVVVGASKGRGGQQERKVDPAKVLENCCLQLGKNEPFNPEVVWKSKTASCGFCSPLIYRDCAYFVNTQGVIFCLDLKTGTEHYSQRLDSGCWASPIADGDNIFLFHKDGAATVLQAGPKFEKLASNRILPKSAGGPNKGGATKKQAADAAPGSQREGGGVFAMLQEKDSKDATKKDSSTPKQDGQGKRPDKKGPPRKGGGGGMPSIDPAVYGVAPVDGAFLVRTGKTLFCIGTPESK